MLSAILQLSPEEVTNIPYLTEAIASQASFFAAVLKNPDLVEPLSPIQLTTGLLPRPFGSFRMAIVNLLAQLSTLNYSSVIRKMADHKLFHIIIVIFRPPPHPLSILSLSLSSDGDWKWNRT